MCLHAFMLQLSMKNGKVMILQLLISTINDICFNNTVQLLLKISRFKDLKLQKKS